MSILKIAVSFAVFLGLPLIFPACACASDADSIVSGQKDPSIGSERKPLNLDPSDGNSWLRLAKPWASPVEDKDSDDKSVKDFLNGKCNKLHGFDASPYQPGRKKYPAGV